MYRALTPEDIAQALSCGQPGCSCGKRSGDGYMAHCPAHRDEKPSLQVTEKGWEAPREVLRWNASQDAVIEALRARNLWPISEKQKNINSLKVSVRGATVQHPRIDPQGVGRSQRISDRWAKGFGGLGCCRGQTTPCNSDTHPLLFARWSGGGGSIPEGPDRRQSLLLAQRGPGLSLWPGPQAPGLVLYWWRGKPTAGRLGARPPGHGYPWGINLAARVGRAFRRDSRFFSGRSPTRRGKHSRPRSAKTSPASWSSRPRKVSRT
jgi:hypothetical protein